MNSARRVRQLVSYIPPGAPARRTPATGDEAFLRPEFGFTPRWYSQYLDIDFGERWHTDPGCRRNWLAHMCRLLKERFAGLKIGWVDDPDEPQDLITGTFGICFVPALYGIEIEYKEDNWPWCGARKLSDEQVDRLQPPDLEQSRFLDDFLEQIHVSRKAYGTARGYVNWQGVLNNAYHLRGEQLFLDLLEHPERARRVFECVTQTMLEAASRVHREQARQGFDVVHFTVSNCMVNLISPRQYHDFLLCHDQRIGKSYETVGVHNCAWSISPYLSDYSEIPRVGYIDMGMDSDLERVRRTFSQARRAVLYKINDLIGKTSLELRSDLERIALQCGPCDLVCSGLDAGVSDERVTEVANICGEVSSRIGDE